MRLPAKQASCDQKNPFLYQATPTPKKNACQNFQPQNPGITPRPHPHPLPTPKYPTLEKNLPTIQTGPSWSSTVKRCGVRWIEKARTRNNKMGGNCYGFFFLAYPSIWWGAWNRVREPWHRGLFFSQVLVLMFAKNLWKRPNKWFAQPLRSSPARYWRKERTTFETLLLAYFLFKLMTWSAQSRTH